MSDTQKDGDTMTNGDDRDPEVVDAVVRSNNRLSIHDQLYAEIDAVVAELIRRGDAREGRAGDRRSTRP